VHDIGNPPFGHFGEYTIREWFQTHLKDLMLGEHKMVDVLFEWQCKDLYLFEGNAQSLRLLSTTPYLGGMNGCRHPLSYRLEAADDIAYRTSDLEDAMVKKVISYTQVVEGFERYAASISDVDGNKYSVCKCIEKLRALYQDEILQKARKPELTAVQRWNQYVREIMLKDAVGAFVKNYHEIMQGDFKGDLFDGMISGHMIQMISRLSEELIYTSSIKIKTELYGRRVIDSLLSQFMQAAVKYDTEEKMTFIECRVMDMVSEFYKAMYHVEAAGRDEGEKLYLRILMITDYISGMTDNYAKRLYQELFA